MSIVEIQDESSAGKKDWSVHYLVGFCLIVSPLPLFVFAAAMGAAGLSLVELFMIFVASLFLGPSIGTGVLLYPRVVGDKNDSEDGTHHVFSRKTRIGLLVALTVAMSLFVPALFFFNLRII